MAERSFLMIPGPTEVPWRVVRAMVQPSIAPHDPEFNLGVLDATVLRLKKIFETDSEVIVFPGSGRVSIDCTIASLIEPGEAVVVTRAGLFGDMVRDVTERVGGTPVVVDVEWGKPLDLHVIEDAIRRSKAKAISLVHNETSTGVTYPLEEVGALARRYGALYLVDTVSSLGGIAIGNDRAGVDVNMAASQKCLAAPMGCGIVAVSHRAFEAMERRKRRATTYAFDLLRWKQLWLPKERGGDVESGLRRQPVGMPIPLVYALAEATTMVLEEGVAARFERHRVAGEAMRGALRAMGLEIFGEERLVSPTVTCAKLPAGMTSDSLVKAVRQQSGIQISAGLGRLVDETIRIGHMGMTAAASHILPTVDAIEAGLRTLGFPVPRGKAAEAAEAVFRG